MQAQSERKAKEKMGKVKIIAQRQRAPERHARAAPCVAAVAGRQLPSRACGVPCGGAGVPCGGAGMATIARAPLRANGNRLAGGRAVAVFIARFSMRRGAGVAVDVLGKMAGGDGGLSCAPTENPSQTPISICIDPYRPASHPPQIGFLPPCSHIRT